MEKPYEQDYLPQTRTETFCSICMKWHLGWKYLGTKDGIKSIQCKFCKTIYRGKE